jgi:hypothetical protein
MDIKILVNIVRESISFLLVDNLYKEISRSSCKSVASHPEQVSLGTEAVKT